MHVYICIAAPKGNIHRGKLLDLETLSSRDPKRYCVTCISKYILQAVNYKGQNNLPEKQSN